MNNEELVNAIQAGQDEYIVQLWKQCNRFIRIKAETYIECSKPSGVDADDLVQCGYFALCEAVRGFAPGRGTFISLLSYKLKNAFRTACGIRTSRRNPLDAAASLDAQIGNDDDSSTLLEILESSDDYIADTEEIIFQEQLSCCIHGAVSHLQERKRIAIEGHFFHGLTYAELARKMSVSDARAGQIVKEGLQSLRKGSDTASLHEFLYGERNLYRNTGYAAWKQSGCSVEERELLYKEALCERYEKIAL